MDKIRLNDLSIKQYATMIISLEIAKETYEQEGKTDFENYKETCDLIEFVKSQRKLIFDK